MDDLIKIYDDEDFETIDLSEVETVERWNIRLANFFIEIHNSIWYGVAGIICWFYLVGHAFRYIHGGRFDPDFKVSKWVDETLGPFWDKLTKKGSFFDKIILNYR